MSTVTPALGVIFHPSFPPETLTTYARRAEEAGFSELWLWDDCFLPGAFTSAAIALTATTHLKVGIGLIPATVYNPLFAAMEITTLAQAFPGRFMPGFGHGVDGWMKQIGAAPLSSIKTLEQTVRTVRALLRGDRVTVHEHGLHLDGVHMERVPDQPPPIYIGAMREKSLQLTGRAAEGTILTGMSAPAYVRWAREQIAAGMRERDPGLQPHRVVVYAEAKVSPDGVTAREVVRRSFASRFGTWAEVHLKALGVWDEARALHEKYGVEMASRMPEAWIDDLSVSGTPEQAAASIARLGEAGADAVILQPLSGDPDCFEAYLRYLLPLFR
jgi:alkanesulfonate monooxygenase SsuD/methylene tetrahydromethanopterin reductase-like flavin-dependent oxidoreductase (luciferase family)